MALKDRLNKKPAKNEIEEEVVEDPIEDAPVEEDAAPASKDPLDAASELVGEEVQIEEDRQAGKRKYKKTIEAEAKTVEEMQNPGLMESVLTGISELSKDNSEQVEKTIKALLKSGNLNKVKDLLSHIQRPDKIKQNFGEKWADYPVCRIVALETVKPNPSVSKFRVGGNDQNSYITGKEFDVPLPVGRYLADKKVAAILSISE